MGTTKTVHRRVWDDFAGMLEQGDGKQATCLTDTAGLKIKKWMSVSYQYNP
jgi:hypothetical protein